MTYDDRLVLSQWKAHNLIWAIEKLPNGKLERYAISRDRACVVETTEVDDTPENRERLYNGTYNR